MNRNIPQFRISVTPSAPEQTRAWVYGRPIKLDYETAHQLGTDYCCKPDGRKIVHDQLKRIWRDHLREAAVARCTYGYQVKGERRCLYGANRSARDDNLESRLALYKEIKRFYTENNQCGIEHTTAYLGNGFKVDSVERHYDEVDLNCPVKVHYEPRSIFAE